MARIIYPEEFTEQRVLFDLVKSKDDADGASSVLTSLLTKKGINLTTDLTAVDEAEVHNANYIQLYLDAEENRKQRDMRVDPVFKGTRAAVQFLKSYYKPDVEALGTWGIRVDGGDRIVYPESFLDRVKLMFKIKARHDSFPPTTSPLELFLTEHGLDLNVAAVVLNDAKTFNADFRKNRRDAEKERKLRDNKMKLVILHLHTIGDYLMKLYVGEEQKAGDWGFTIDYSPREPKLRTSTIRPSSQKTTTGIVIGSIFTNTGTVELYLYKGRTKKGEPVIVQPGATKGMNDGYSSVTVVNNSDIITGEYQTLIHR